MDPVSLSTSRTGSDLVQSSPKGTSYLPRLSRALLPRPSSGGQEVVSRPETEESRGPQKFQPARWRVLRPRHYPCPSRSLFRELLSVAARRL
jgi:hypothetical protein